jgi:gag-polypeptide of LTR copia-type
MSIPDSVYLRIKGAAHAKDMWSQLKGMFEGWSWMLTTNAWRRLTNTRCKEGEDIQAHFDYMQQFQEWLESLGKSLEEEDYASILMASLPPSYNALIEMLTQNADTNKTDITSDLIYKRVCDAYDKHLLRQDENGNGQDESFTTLTRKPKDKKNVECYNCHKKGHIKADCWAKGGGKEGQGPRPRQGGTPENVAVASDKPKDKLWATIEVIDAEGNTPMAAAVTADQHCAP